MQHLGPGWPPGKWIMIISPLETTETHMGPSPHIRSISGEALSSAILNIVMAAPQKKQDSHKGAIQHVVCSFDFMWFLAKQNCFPL